MPNNRAALARLWPVSYFCLPHFEHLPTFAYSFANISINDGCVSGCVLFAFYFFHVGTGEVGPHRSGSRCGKTGRRGQTAMVVVEKSVNGGGLIFGLPAVRGT